MAMPRFRNPLEALAAGIGQGLPGGMEAGLQEEADRRKQARAFENLMNEMMLKNQMEELGQSQVSPLEFMQGAEALRSGEASNMLERRRTIGEANALPVSVARPPLGGEIATKQMKPSPVDEELYGILSRPRREAPSMGVARFKSEHPTAGKEADFSTRVSRAIGNRVKTLGVQSVRGIPQSDYPAIVGQLEIDLKRKLSKQELSTVLVMLKGD